MLFLVLVSLSVLNMILIIRSIRSKQKIMMLLKVQ